MQRLSMASALSGLALWAFAGWLVSADSPLPVRPGFRIDWVIAFCTAFGMLGLANAGLLAGFMPLARWSLGRPVGYSTRTAVITGIFERSLFTGFMALFVGAGRANIRLFQTGELIWALLIISTAYVLLKSVRINQPTTATRLVSIDSLWGGMVSIGTALISGWYFWKILDTMDRTSLFR